MSAKAKKFEIEKIPADFDFDEFHTKYFVPERPVVMQGIGQKIQRGEELTIENIREKIVEKGLATVNTFWFEGPSEMLELLADTPEIVAREMAESHLREKHCRLWLNGPGNLTPSHYDGNMLFVFNLQLKGRKEWRIVSPDTPMRNYPFSRAALFPSEENSEPQKGIEYCDFALEEGDMIYLPPMWHHAVKATAPQNININWIGTRKSGHVYSKTLQRERELLKYAHLCYKLTGRTKLHNKILGAGIEGYLENYGGVGWDFIAEQTTDVKLHQVALRFFKEVAMAPFALKDSKKLKAQMKKKPLDSVKKEKPAVA